MGIRLTVRSTWSGDGDSSPLAYEFDQERVVIGRGAGSDVRLPHHAVSAHHATLRTQGAGWVVTDEGSTNGTWVGETRLPPKRPKPLRTGDVINLGGFALTVTVGVPVSAATSSERTSAYARKLVRELVGGETPPPRLLVLHGPDANRALDVPDPPVRLVIGRGETCDFVLADADASREHAEIERDLDGVVIRDLESKNGVRVNDRVVRERRLRDRDEVRIGETVLVFEDAAEGMLGEIATAADVAMETPRWAAREEPAASDGATVTTTATLAQPPAAPLASPPAARPRTGPGADVIIYLLAGAVLALSIAGLVILLQSG